MGLTKGFSYGIIPKHSGDCAEYRGVEQLEARRAHNPEVVGSSPASATISSVHNGFDRCGHSIFSVHAFYSEETVGLGAFLLICCIYQIYLL